VAAITSYNTATFSYIRCATSSGHKAHHCTGGAGVLQEAAEDIFLQHVVGLILGWWHHSLLIIMFIPLVNIVGQFLIGVLFVPSSCT